MPIDASIPLKINPPPSAMQTIGGLLNMQRLQAAIQGQNIANQSAQGNLNETMALRSLINDPSVHNADGTLNQDAYLQRAQQVAPTLGAGQATASANANTANTQANRAHFQLEGAQAKVGLETAQGALGDPRIMGRNGQPPDPTQAATALAERETEMVNRGVPLAKAKMLMGPYYTAAAHDPASLPQLLTNSVKAGIGAQAQLGANTPQPAFVNTQQGITPVNVNPNAGAVAPMGPSMTPPNQVIPTTSGGSAIANTTTGMVGDFRGGPSVNLPAGETSQTQNTLQAERQAALNVVQQAPTLHNINQTVRNIVTSGVTTGKLGEFWRDMSSKTGYTFGSDNAHNFNMLEPPRESRRLVGVSHAVAGDSVS